MKTNPTLPEISPLPTELPAWNAPDMEALTGLCKRKGFIFPSCEVYGGWGGFFDYGPLGTEMKQNIKQAWWQDMVHRRDDMVGLDSAIIGHPRVWEASGHVGGFSDPMVDCKVSKMRYRADQLLFAPVSVQGELLGYVSVLESDADLALQEAQRGANKLKDQAAVPGPLDPLVLRPYTQASPDQYAHIPSPATGKPGSLTPPRDFNLMFTTHVGALTDAASQSYLRPETAQGIFVNFKNILDSTRVKIPFGVAQVGKAFRNEITPRHFIFRSREFEQMEIEYFIDPHPEHWQQVHATWVQTCWNWLLSIGIRPEALALQEHPKDGLAHYAKACTDILFRFPFGCQELQGIAARGCFDLTQHAQHSGQKLEYFDESTQERYTPHVIEPSLGVDRLFLALLCSAYDEECVEGEKRAVLRLHPRIAPIKVAVLPLVKNKPVLLEKAQAIFKRLQRRYACYWDATGAIGRRYRRMDEVGTPYCVTVDFDTLENDTVTLRHRDTMAQERLTVPEVLQRLALAIEGE
jgi:glycyl-tRNA synthetase